VTPKEANPGVLPPSVNPMSTGGATPIEFKGTAGEVKPAGVPERAPTTSFDVDLYQPTAADTYETISRKYYNDLRYARALAEFNQRRPLQNQGPVEVPPIHILKKRYPQLIGTATTAAEWQPASATVPVANTRATGPSTYVVPAGGTTMRVVAQIALGTEKRWLEIYDLNPQFAPDSVPAGAELKLPANATVPK
jgi:hypothetical protein